MEVKVDRRYFSDRVPILYVHPEDEWSFLAKLHRAFVGGCDFRKEIVTVLAWLLCEALGEEEAEMSTLFTEDSRMFLDKDLVRICPVWQIDQVIRGCLRDQLGLPPDGFVEVADKSTLDRIAGLATVAIASFILVNNRVKANDQIPV